MARKDGPVPNAVLMTEAPLKNPRDRERMTEIVFESFQAPKFYLSVQAVLALYAANRTTGLVVSCGEDAMHTVYDICLYKRSICLH